ncbi:MAG TPA: hypothetical protein VFM08_02865 [Nocardioides sp.]|nr:hypothetical protein [Nocardioides sp.]
MAGYRVTLFANYLGRGPHWARLDSDVSNSAGHFRLSYQLRKTQFADSPLLFLQARRGKVLLASALGPAASVDGGSVTVNERTTVATGTAYARFVRGTRVDGNKYGMRNAAAMAANLADPSTGAVGAVLASVPNGSETSTLATFNSLTNVIDACIASRRSCLDLFAATAPPRRQPSRNVLQSVARIARYPSYPDYRKVSGDPLFELSRRTPVNTPSLTTEPTNWLLFLKFTGGDYSTQDSDNLINGIGNFAIDAKGFAWGNDNAEPEPEGTIACAGERLLKFDPSGQPVPNTPYFGGGLSGVGYGITLDPDGHVWVGNFGFQDPPCFFRPGVRARHNSVSEFGPNGHPISGEHGYRAGNIRWPQGTISDRSGNIWLANCGNDTVTMYPHGNPAKAVNIPLGPTPPARRPQMKPFGLATDAHGNIWAVNNRGNSVSVISPHGKLLETLPGTYKGKTVLSHPVANAADLEGNMWVTNSDWLDSPCPTRTQLGTAENPSITLFRQDTRTPYPGSPFTGGGLTLPWGIAVDGADTVWAFNFGNSPVEPDGSQPTDIPTGISRFCGIRTENCPRGLKVGDPITPGTGYRSDSLERITGAEIDPSGNIWITNNWKLDANPFVNPFGNSFVIAVGAAAPLKTPLIGPPVSFGGRR